MSIMNLPGPAQSTIPWSTEPSCQLSPADMINTGSPECQGPCLGTTCCSEGGCDKPLGSLTSG